MIFFDNSDFEITDPQMQAAVDEIQQLILTHFPSTTFTVGDGMECGSVYMRVIVDVDDLDEVADVFMHRLVDFQVDENLPLYVVTVHTPEQQIAAREREKAERRFTAFPSRMS